MGLERENRSVPRRRQTKARLSWAILRVIRYRECAPAPETRQTAAATSARRASAVAPSAGKKDSIASSDSVTSIGVPNTVVVLMKESVPAGVTDWKGTTTPAVL